MLKGFQAKKCLFFTVDGKPVAGGNFFGTGPERKSTTPLGERYGNYWKMVNHIAKQAMLEQDWETTDEAIYMCVYIYVPPSPKTGIKAKAECYENKRFAMNYPQMMGYVHRLAKVLVGTVYKKEVQIVALQVFKEYDREPRAEVFIGIPADWEGIENDLSRAE